MNEHNKLQLFADGGDGGEGAATAAQPSEARLRELGVPEARLQKRARRAEKNRGNEVSAVPDAPQGDGAKADAPKAVPKEGRVGQGLRTHYDGIHRQALAMGQKYPDFNLERELNNPTFLQLTGPKVGLSVEDAYVAVHHRELMEAVARGARQEAANAIRAGGSRPVEHGMGAKAPAVVTFDYKNATRSQRAAFKKQIYEAAARGEKIYPAR